MKLSKLLILAFFILSTIQLVNAIPLFGGEPSTQGIINNYYNNTYNTTIINNTIVGNSSWNQSLADTLYAPIIWAYNQTTAAINYVNNNFYNSTYINTNFIQWANESILNVNSSLYTNYSFFSNYSYFSNLSTYWANLNGYNSTWFWNDNSKLNLNETKLNSSIDAKLVPTVYLPTNVTNVTGINIVGNLTSIQAMDNIFYNVSEVAGSPGFDIRVNFTNVSGTFNEIDMVEIYNGGLGHTWDVELWDYNTLSWQTQDGTFTDQATTTESVIPVLDYSSHVNNSLVQLRFYHITNGNTNHRFNIDYVALVNAVGSALPTNHDSMTNRNSLTNHPWALDIYGNRTIDHLNVTNNVTATAFQSGNASIYWNGSVLIIKVT